MAKSPQALTRQTILEYVGPSVADIIFFERKDSRLPGYAAPPKYGTAHPDTSKWPGHKLALVRPDRNEPGYVLWYYVADREGQDDYNFEIKDKKLVRTYIVPREDYLDGSFPAPAVDAPDAVFPAYTYTRQDVVRTGDAELDSLYVVVQRRYDNLDADDDGSVESDGSEDAEAVTENAIVPGEDVTVRRKGREAIAEVGPDGFVTTRQSVETEENLWTNTTEKRIPRDSTAASAVELRPGFKRTTTSAFVSAAHPQNTTPGMVSQDWKTVAVDVEGDERQWSKDTTGIANNPSTGSKWVQTLHGGVARVTYETVDDGHLADEGYDVIGSEVDPFGDGQALKTTTKLVDGYATLAGTEYDARTGAVITVTKSVVPAGTLGSAAGDTVIEVQPYDKWRSIQVVSRLSSDLSSLGFSNVPCSVTFPLPAVLHEARMRFINVYATGSPPAWAHDSALMLDMSPPDNGPFPGYAHRIVSRNPNAGPDPTAIPRFKTRAHSIYYDYWRTRSVLIGDGAGQATAQIKQFSIPASVHPAMVIMGVALEEEYARDGEAKGGGNAAVIPASDPPVLPVGRTVVAVGTPEKWRFGYWVIEWREALL